MPDNIKFYKIKKEIRILGIDDSPFDLHRDSGAQAMLVGVILRGGNWIDAVLSTKVEIDGNDSTDKISEMVNATRHKDLRIIMLSGVTFAGFNVADLKKIFENTNLPVIAFTRNYPEFEKIKKALQVNFTDWQARWESIENAGEPIPVAVEKKGKIKDDRIVYMQKYGIEVEDAKEILRLSITRGFVPEPIRIAHIIGSGIVSGDSKGGA